MILAAGRGERMRPLTERLPKPLLEVGGHRLIEYHLAALREFGVHDVVINLSWHGAHSRAFGDGNRSGLQSVTARRGPAARPAADCSPLPLRRCAFLVLNGDVWATFRFARSRHFPFSCASCWSGAGTIRRRLRARARRPSDGGPRDVPGSVRGLRGGRC
jgi:MurNAc alpha-1-phosphate uridylyltransferase